MTWVVDLARQRAAEEPTLPLFGVIVYTDRHVHMKKILRDDDYWRAFDELTGPRWDVFSIRAQDGVWSPPSAPSRSFAMMRMVWKEPEANRELVDAFELDDTSDLPAVVIFCLAGEDLSRTVVRIDDSNADSAFDSLKSVFVKVATVLEDLPPASLGDHAHVYDAVRSGLKTHVAWRRVRAGYKVLKELRDWLPL